MLNKVKSSLLTATLVFGVISGQNLLSSDINAPNSDINSINNEVAWKPTKPRDNKCKKLAGECPEKIILWFDFPTTWFS